MSNAEATLLLHLRVHGLPEGEAEVRFDPTRRWRFDRAWPERRLAVEVEGGVWRRGRHTRGKGYEADLCKYNAATLAGWKVLRFSAGQVRNGEAIRVLRKVLSGEAA
jgi:very-short-patch-repair endonuclease